MMPTSLDLPPDLPVPTDDGGASHLVGRKAPALSLPATMGGAVDLSQVAGRAVVYCYPMTGRPDVPLPEGWNEIPGARGCTPQSTSYKAHYDELKARGARHVFGLSTQSTEYQLEMSQRLDLPFPVLSDHTRAFADALQLPTFSVPEVGVLLKRLTLVLNDGTVEQVHYPVFPTDKDPDWVIDYLTTNPL
mmetsp:Transcript_20160/g.64935  ORF Transcript_20160/g.64935 Transcript_20160/m.64935 type:complete len:190 (+) Transcript_20160:39-608(+)